MNKTYSTYKGKTIVKTEIGMGRTADRFWTVSGVKFTSYAEAKQFIARTGN